MTIATMLSLGETALKLGLICSLTVLALFLSYSMLNVCDLSTDGCFTFGAAVGAVVAVSGHPFLSIAAAMAAGVTSGFVTAILQTKLGVRLGRLLRLADEVRQDALIAFMKIEHAGQRTDHDRDQGEHRRDRRDRQPLALAHAPDAVTAACGCLSAHIFSSGIDRMDSNFKETSI